MNEDFFEWYKTNMFKDHNDKEILVTVMAWAAAAKLMKEKIFKIIKEKSVYYGKDGEDKTNHLFIIDDKIIQEIKKL